MFSFLCALLAIFFFCETLKHQQLRIPRLDDDFPKYKRGCKLYQTLVDAVLCVQPPFPPNASSSPFNRAVTFWNPHPLFKPDDCFLFASLFFFVLFFIATGLLHVLYAQEKTGPVVGLWFSPLSLSIFSSFPGLCLFSCDVNPSVRCCLPFSDTFENVCMCCANVPLSPGVLPLFSPSLVTSKKERRRRRRGPLGSSLIVQPTLDSHLILCFFLLRNSALFVYNLSTTPYDQRGTFSLLCFLVSLFVLFPPCVPVQASCRFKHCRTGIAPRHLSWGNLLQINTRAYYRFVSGRTGGFVCACVFLFPSIAGKQI